MNLQSKHYNFAILASHSYDSYLDWIKAIEESDKDLNYSIIFLDSSNWLDQIQSGNFDMVLISPPFMTIKTKNMCDERLFVISQLLNIPVYPDFKSFMVYENKRLLDYILDIYEIPRPETWNFHNKQEALEFTGNCPYPIVAKIITGSAGIGVKFLRNKQQAQQYIKTAFSKGVRSVTGPGIRRGGLIKRFIAGFHKVGYFKKLLTNYKSIFYERQVGYVFLQECINHTYEWRCVRIDDSYFFHKKVVKGRMASGSLIKEYGAPPQSLMDFVRFVSDKIGVYSAAFDIFETLEKGYLVNEVQAFFGQSDPYQMVIDGIPGRYLYNKEQWIFEPGDFNRNKSYNLRLNHVFKMLSHP